MTRAPFWVYSDDARGLALLRGDVRGLLDETGVRDRARWSLGGRGWVLTTADVADLLAVADHAGRTYRVRPVGGDAA